jgi:hypothetical protein
MTAAGGGNNLRIADRIGGLFITGRFDSRIALQIGQLAIK